MLDNASAYRSMIVGNNALTWQHIARLQQLKKPLEVVIFHNAQWEFG
jgi:hypothetical protein